MRTIGSRASTSNHERQPRLDTPDLPTRPSRPFLFYFLRLGTLGFKGLIPGRIQEDSRAPAHSWSRGAWSIASPWA